MRHLALALVTFFGAFSACATEDTGEGDAKQDGTGGTPVTPAGGAGGGGGAECVPQDETCNGSDDDCDGEVDEGCTCTEGETQPCYSGRPDTRGVGACTAGQQTCTASGRWGACAREVTPVEETCDGADEDCDGEVDDLGDQTCGIGACQVTVPACAGGRPVSCTPASPQLETCDGIDNDCDQLVDEAFAEKDQPCTTGQPGICSPGTFQCESGAQVCVSNESAGNELCNGIDDDCNGTTDDNIPGTGGPCSTGLPGPCDAGTITCQNGVVDCFPDEAPVAELCDGIDNDCDGTTDEEDPGGGAVCDTGQAGVCQSGIEHCLGGALDCVADLAPSPEVCNGQDEDCDGAIDEGNPGGGQQCGCGGTTFCLNGAVTCVGGPTVFFEDSFSDGNSKGWTLGTEWQIGPAVAGCADPGTDHTVATADNNVAGVVLGGCYSDLVAHPFVYLESPPFDASAGASATLEYWRWLQSDYAPFVVNVIEVFDGATWQVIWQTAGSPGVADTAWTKQQFNVSAHKNAQMRVRFGFSVSGTAAIVDGGWNVDDIKVTATACP